MNSIYLYRNVLNPGPFHDWARSYGLTALVPDLHVTLAYSKAPVDWKRPEFLPLTDVIEVTGERDLVRFGDAMVMRFTDIRLSRRWAQLTMVGAQWDYPNFQPHVTFAYDPAADISKLRAPTAPLRLGREHREVITADYIPPTK